MAIVKEEKINDKLKVISFVDENGNELSFGLLKNNPIIQVSHIWKIQKAVISRTATLSKHWLTKNIPTYIKDLNDRGLLQFKTPLGRCFNLTKDNLIKLNNFLNSQDFIF